MSGGALSVDSSSLHGVAGQCAYIQSQLGQQAATLKLLSGSLQYVLRGSAVTAFEMNFAHWITNLQKVDSELATATRVLSQVAALADTQHSLLASLALS